MELPKPPQKGHSRGPSNESSRKLVTSPRRRTLGPLDLGDISTTSLGSPLLQSPFEPTGVSITHPLQTPPSTTTTTTVTQNPSSPAPSAAITSPTSPPPNSPSPRPLLPTREFPHLLHAHLFHPLPNHDLPLPFRQSQSSSTTYPSPTTPLPTLLTQGYFRAAAIACAALLPTISPSNHTEIFNLWYIRLSCLCLIGATQIACVEVKALEDLSAPGYWVAETPALGGGRGQKRHLVPWELRLLVIRLQALSFSDWRRALVFYYELAREARMELGRAINTKPNPDPVVIKLWKSRLKDLSIRVASALVEMGDFAAAVRHLETLRKTGGSGEVEAEVVEEDAKVRFMLGLLYIRIGNFSAAKESLPPPPQPASPKPSDNPLTHQTAPTYFYTDHILTSLLPTALGLWEASITAWSTPPPSSSSLHPPPSTILERHNLAVSLVYTGRLSQARDILEDLLEEGNAFFALTFNLCTLWELVTDGDVTKDKKRDVAEKVLAAGGRREAGAAWFKM